MELKPITKARVSETVVIQLKKFIVSQKLQPGSKLPSERELVGKMEISRASVREALRILEIMGFVIAKPGKGVFVKSLTPDLLMPLSVWLPTHQDTLHDHFEARLMLEPGAAGLAALRATPRDMAGLQENERIFKERLLHQDLVGLIKADMAFHTLIGAATGNKTIKMFMETITRLLFDGWKASLRLEGRPQKTVKEHGRIIKALLNKDPGQAQEAMRRHLQKALKHLKEKGLD
jgi:GntR family transcriptional repressor for pyruvate dehydrogenase complex